MANSTPSPEPPGALVISLDFEINWGVRDQQTLAQYGPHLLGVRQAVPAMLELFAEYGLHATWATVGLLFFRTKAELLAHLPAVQPQYADPNLSPYLALDAVGEDEAHDPYHFGYSLIQQIKATPGQEMASHTFCHYYCLERGQTLEAFRADLQAAEQRRDDAFANLLLPELLETADLLQTHDRILAGLTGQQAPRQPKACSSAADSGQPTVLAKPAISVMPVMALDRRAHV